MALSTLTLWCNHHHHFSPELFYFLHLKLWPIKHKFLIFLSSQLLATAILPFLSMNLMTLGASSKWSLENNVY